MSPSSTTQPPIPSTQRAAIIQKFTHPLSILSTHPVPTPSSLLPNQCLVKMECTGVCHSDLHARNGDWGRTPTLPRVGGHEGVGWVVAIGEGTVQGEEGDGVVQLGDRVGLKWLASTCLRCEFCRNGNESSCAKQKVHGYTVDGTFAEYVVAWVDYVTPIPDALDSRAATAMLCAGLTVYKGLKQSNARAGEWIAIPGAGGGLGHLAIQYAVMMGLRVLAIDTTPAKRSLALSLGAEKWIDFKESGENLVRDVIAATDGGPHVALVAAGAALPYNQAPYYLRPTGTLVAVGLPAGAPFEVPFGVLVGRELKVIGSAIGNRQDAIDALSHAARGKVKCHYTTRKLEDVESVFAEMTEGKITGRIILDF
ncbi:chaperonin 10-like protein [Hygrophoropsis aurantiaca]|uniref:Chaperonin 10-like protein n=1 Tax=Hygrophoropsis aurantiaca TaxID=72124 RepID=A0ACB8ABN8_9AGAM|nr:chaperonin 10-like protein [Hygrophoropsis aurantiaca]